MRECEIAAAVEILRAGGLVAFPTETVYGLGADAANPQAVARIFAAKGRPADHPLIVHLARASELDAWAKAVPPSARALAERFWPGPLTLILKRAPHVNAVVTGGQDTVGLRVPSHPVAQALLQAFGAGVAAPSANRFGRLSPTTAEHVRSELGGAVDLILDAGACPGGIESTIVDCSGQEPALLRPGLISAAELEAALGEKLAPPRRQSPRVPGRLPSHYAPATPLRLVSEEELPGLVAGPKGARFGVLARRSPPPEAGCSQWITAPRDAEGYARGLYASLHWLDKSGCQLILVEAPPPGPEWAAVRDRLARAATGSLPEAP